MKKKYEIKIIIPNINDYQKIIFYLDDIKTLYDELGYNYVGEKYGTFYFKGYEIDDLECLEKYISVKWYLDLLNVAYRKEYGILLEWWENYV